MSILRMTVDKIKRLYLSLAAYEHHRLANRASEQLRMHSTATLKDLGLTRGTIAAAAHHKCPWCHAAVWAKWLE
jgi:uncharacterized protein YjiS (DUF1127 family)